MKSLRRIVASIALLLAATALPHATASDPDIVFVDAGLILEDRPTYDFTKFYPPQFRVHSGQTVQWSINGFHTVTFLPNDDPSTHPAIWREDEAPGTLAANEAWAFPSGDCGHPDKPACSIAGTDTYISSGVPLAPGMDKFRATIDLPPGSYRFHCNVHPPMHGVVTVVPDDVPLDNPDAAAIAAMIDQDVSEADAVVAANQEADAEVLPDGSTRWTVKVGERTPDRDVSILEFLPGTLPIAAGDEVTFDLTDDIHTVSFPGATQGPQTMFGLITGCELDEPAGGAPGFPLFPPICPPGTNVEARVSPWLSEQQRAPGDGVTTPATIHNSGIMTLEEDPAWFSRRTGGESPHWPVSFSAGFPVAGEFAYGCLIHGEVMKAGVVVE